MRRQSSVLFAAALAVGAVLGSSACGRERPEPQKLPSVPEVFPQLPVPPQAKFIGRAGSSDALQLTFESSEPGAQVATYYRAVLGHEPWRLVSDHAAAGGGVTLYAERGDAPFWVQITPDSATGGSMVQLSGAVVQRAAQAGPADSTVRTAPR